MLTQAVNVNFWVTDCHPFKKWNLAPFHSSPLLYLSENFESIFEMEESQSQNTDPALGSSNEHPVIIPDDCGSDTDMTDQPFQSSEVEFSRDVSPSTPSDILSSVPSNVSRPLSPTASPTASSITLLPSSNPQSTVSGTQPGVSGQVIESRHTGTLKP